MYTEIAPNYNRFCVVENSYINSVLGACFETTAECWDLSSANNDAMDSVEAMMGLKLKSKPFLKCEEYIEYVYKISKEKSREILSSFLGKNEVISSDIELKRQMNSLSEEKFEALINKFSSVWESEELYSDCNGVKILEELIISRT